MPADGDAGFADEDRHKVDSEYRRLQKCRQSSHLSFLGIRKQIGDNAGPARSADLNHYRFACKGHHQVELAPGRIDVASHDNAAAPLQELGGDLFPEPSELRAICGQFGRWHTVTVPQQGRRINTYGSRLQRADLCLFRATSRFSARLAIASLRLRTLSCSRSSFR